MIEKKKFDFQVFLQSISSYPDCKLSIYCHGTNNLPYILEIWKNLRIIYIYISDLDKKIVFEENLNSDWDYDTPNKFLSIKKYINSLILTYESKYYIFIHANDICKGWMDLDYTFEEKRNIFIPELNISTFKINEFNPRNTFMCYEAYGLIFKRRFYINHYSDFGDENMIYEISPNSKYSRMYGKPIIQIYVNPAHRSKSVIFNIDGSQHDQKQSVFNFSELFYDNKSYICINYDEIPNSFWLDSTQNTPLFERKKFAPNVHKDCFIISQVGWTANEHL